MLKGKKKKSKMKRHHTRLDYGKFLELADGEFKITMVNMLRVLMKKVNMQKQMDNISRERETLREKENTRKNEND